MAEATARAWNTVLEKIEDDLQSGRIGPGDRLPAERDLASSLGVGRSSVREAFRVLEGLGLIRTSTGSGPTAGAFVVSAPASGMNLLMRLQVASQSFPVADIVATRVILEAAVVGALAGGPRDIGSTARAALDAMDSPGLAPAEFLALDAQFHLAMAQISGNEVVSTMMASLRGSIEAYVSGGALRLTDWDATAQRLRAEHREIASAISAGQGEHARTLVSDHITTYYAETGVSPTPAPSRSKDNS